MSRMPWATYLWPGLPQLWFSGLWSGLVLAAGFAVLLNLLLLASLVWVELLSPPHLRLGWLAVGVLWSGSAILSAGHARRGATQGTASAEALFREALSEYLQGSWFEAETILGRLLQRHPRDVEARLLLATLLRHARRYPEALDQLDRLERLRDATKWTQEIAAERKWMTNGPVSEAPADAGAANELEGTADKGVPPATAQAA
jgi:tetratricopeptide (TPR) repeat protein